MSFVIIYSLFFELNWNVYHPFSVTVTADELTERVFQLLVPALRYCSVPPLAFAVVRLIFLLVAHTLLLALTTSVGAGAAGAVGDCGVPKSTSAYLYVVAPVVS